MGRDIFYKQITADYLPIGLGQEKIGQMTSSKTSNAGD
jgi:hypothetical protein